MEVDVRQSLREDRMSDCRSFGSNYHPSSQSRKMSIGVLPDSLAKRKAGATKEDEGKLLNTERNKSTTGISTEGKNKGEAVITAKGKLNGDAEQVKSPWITPRSFHQNSLAPETVFFPEETSNSRKKKPNDVKDVSVTYSVQFFQNQNLSAQNVGSNQNKLNGLTYKRKGGKDGNSQGVEEFNFANGCKVLESDKVPLEDKEDKTQNVQTETLKMKLQELFRTVSSPKSLQSSSESHEVNANNLKPETITDHKGDAVVKPIQNSDTIETDSDNPDKTIKRPVTRSLTRKRAPAKVQPDKTKVGLSSKQKPRESIFSFGEGRPTKLDGAVNGGSSLSRKMKIQKKSSKIDPRKICFPEEDNAEEIQRTTYRSETPLPAEKNSLLGNKNESFPSSFSEKRRENLEKVQEKNSFYSPVTNETNQKFNFDNPTSPEKGDQEEGFGNISLRNVVYTQHDFQSPTFVNSGSSLSRKMKIQKKSSKIDPRKICFPEEDNAEEIQQTTHRSETLVPAEKTSLLGNKNERFPGSFNEKRRENLEKVQEKNSFHSPVTNETNQKFNFDNPTSPGKGDKQEDLGNISLRNVVYTQHDFQSPTFGFKTPTLNTSLSPTPKTVEIEQGDCSPVPSERGFTIGNIRSFRTFQTSRPGCNKLNAQAQSPDDAEKNIDSSPKNPMHTKEKFDAASEDSESSSEERWSESFEEGHRENIISPETIIAEKPNFVQCPIKRLRNHEDVRLSKFCPTSPSQKVAGVGESYWFQEPSEQDQEDELTRAVTLFALALETFKRKMDSATRKKSSEILMSISEEIKSLLLNAESQIESDVGNLTSLCKTKRKRPETRFQEQQEQLKLILEKFKEDIHRHLLDCRSTLEGMEAHQIELKGIMKKQKVSHQKLLMHVEEAVEIQINNAERRITAVHESAREKMLQLKHVIAECLKDGIY